MLVLSLFPGIGLLDRAFEEEGFCVVRGPDVLWGGDIRRFHPPAGKFDGVIGGPPCQSFSSLVHLVRANGHEPRFGDLIPEFERCIIEAMPDWCLMENVPQAPEPVVPGYGVKSFLLDNSALDGGDGHGLEQRRVRRFSFGLRGRDAPDLRRWIDLAVFLLPDAERTATQFAVNNSQEAKGRVTAVFGDGRPTRQEVCHGTKVCDRCRSREATKKVEENNQEKWLYEGCYCDECAAYKTAIKDGKPLEMRVRRQTVLSDPSAVPVKIGGSGKVKRTAQVCVTFTDGGLRPGERRKAVSGSNGGTGKDRSTPGAGNNGKGRYRLADACRLQGLPEGFLDDAPFTAEGKLKAVANGVPIPMGRAIARAAKEAIAQ